MKKMKKSYNIIIDIFFILTGFVGAYMLCRLCGGSLEAIFLPNGWVSDEVSYFKQIEAMIEFGMPKGYWGYNESTALIGTYGAWSFFNFLPYALLGKIIGWNYYSPIICNLIIIELAFSFFIYLTKMNKKSLLMISMFFLLVPFYSRYIVSGMVETVVFSLLIILFGLVISLNVEFSYKKLFCFYFIVFYLSMVRPYFLLLYLFPIIYFSNKTIKILLQFLCFTTIIIIVSIIGYFLVSYLYCSSYVQSFGFTFILELFHTKGIIGGIIESKNLLILKVSEIWDMLLMREPNLYRYGVCYSIYLLSEIILFFYFLFTLKNKNKYKMFLEIFTMIMNFTVLLAIIFLYDIYAGARHTLALSLWTLLIIAINSRRSTKILTIIGLSIILFLYCPKDDFSYRIPFADRKDKENANKIVEELEKVCGDYEDGWEGTVDFFVNEVDFNIAYFFPKGIGIQIMLEEIDDYSALERLNARYYVTKPESNLAQICRENCKLIFISQDKEFCLWQKIEHIGNENKVLVENGEW